MAKDEFPECSVCGTKGMWGMLRFYNDCFYMCETHMKVIREYFDRCVRLGKKGIGV